MRVVANTVHWAWLVILAGMSGSACSSEFFDVENPAEIPAEKVESTQLIDALANTPPGVAAEIYGGGVVRSGLIADDIIQPSTQISQIWLDRGEFQHDNVYVYDYYDELVARRWQATDAVERLKRLMPDNPNHVAIGRGYFWDAIIRIALADMFEVATFDGGPPHSPVQVYEMALDLLAQAVEVAEGSDEDLQYRAALYATIARVHRSLYFELDALDHLQRAAEYAEQALAVNPNFQFDVIYQTPGASNPVFTSIGQGLGNLGAGERFADWRDPVSGVRDPRIEIAEEPIGFGPHGPFYHARKYGTRDADVPLSRWQEARLILAEHDFVTGDLPGAIQHINAVRLAAGLVGFQSNIPDEIREQIIYERETEFWLEFRNWQDKRYYGIFPERWTPASRELGLDRRLPISLRERNSNPNF